MKYNWRIVLGRWEKARSFASLEKIPIIHAKSSIFSLLMPRSNIVFFTGPNHIFLRRDLDAWIDIFAKKYGEYNISRINIESLGKTNIQAELLTPVFLGEKRLIVLEGIPFASVKASDDENKEET